MTDLITRLRGPAPSILAMRDAADEIARTVGMRLRQADVSERTQDEILWHSKKDMTTHYTVAQVREVYDALEAIKEEGEAGETLNLLALVRRTQIKSLPQNYPTQRKTA